VIARFTTGNGPDATPPILAGVTLSTERYACPIGTSCEGPDAPEYALHTIASVTDDHPVAWLRYEHLDASGALVVGPTTLPPRVAQHCGGAVGHTTIAVPQTFQLRAVDLAGNRELWPHALVAEPCAELARGTACAAPDAADAAGCGCTGGPGGRAGGLAVIAGAVVVAARRRRRCSEP
jgi:MYXO-CTERM domain-containing protein